MYHWCACQCHTSTTECSLKSTVKTETGLCTWGLTIFRNVQDSCTVSKVQWLTKCCTQQQHHIVCELTHNTHTRRRCVIWINTEKCNTTLCVPPRTFTKNGSSSCAFNSPARNTIVKRPLQYYQTLIDGKRASISTLKPAQWQIVRTSVNKRRLDEDDDEQWECGNV